MRYYSVILLCLLAPSIAFSAIAEKDCHNVDLSSKFGPVRSQRSSEQCYANVAADLIGFNQGLPPSKQVSVIDVSMAFYSAKPEDFKKLASNGDFFESRMVLGGDVYGIKERQKKLDGQPIYMRLMYGGVSKYAVNAYNFREGICLEEEVPSEGPSPFFKSHFSFQSKLNSLQTGEEPELFLSSLMIGSPTAIPIIKKSQTSLCVPKSPLDKVLSFEEELNNHQITEIDNAVKKACKNRLYMKPMIPHAIKVSDGPDPIYPLMLAEMLQDGIPPGISYDPAFLTQGSGVGYTASSHASIVVASRWNGSFCEFKIRNSYGVSCDMYAPEYKPKCEGGNVWVSESDLSTRIGAVTYIKPQK